MALGLENRPCQRERQVVWWLGFLLLPTLLAGCSPTYVMRAAWEEGRILWSREPIEEVLGRGELSEQERHRLELVLETRRFAADELGLAVGGAYGSLARVDDQALVWVVSAAERLRLRSYLWWFPIVGDVAYKGYFERSDADAEALSLREDGWDTYIRSSSAFSTLGWFDDPVLSSWLELEPVPLVRLVIHELLHRTTYVAGATAYNESFATFVGGTGAIEFFASREGEAAPQTETARAAWREDIARSQRWALGMEKLRELYRAGEEGRLDESAVLAGREEIFESFGARRKINNAVLLAHYAYLEELAGFDCALAAGGGDLRAVVGALAAASEARSADPFSALGECRETAAR